MAAEAAAPADGAGWIGTALDGGGSWKMRSKIPYLLGFLMLFDSWDSVIIAYTLPTISAEWQLSPLSAGTLISAGYGGQFIGAMVFGMLAERVGRLPVVRWLVIFMSILAVACALAGNYEQLVLLRLVQGVAIGGALPVTICYVNEVAPTATRGKFFGTFQFLMLAGFGLAALMSAWLVPIYGWRVMFALGAVPLLLVPFLYMIPESPRWLAGRGKPEAAALSVLRLGGETVAAPQDVAAGPETAPRRVPLAELFAPEVRRKTIIIAVLWFLTSLVSYGLLNWVPTIYVEMFGIPVDKALSYNSIVAVSIFFLPILLRQTIDRIGRRPPPLAGTLIAGAALLAVLLVPGNGWMLIVALVIVGQIGVSISSMVLWPYTAEVFDTRTRSIALGMASSLARAASMMTPLLVGGILQWTGSVTMVFVTFGVASLIVALLWWRGTRETAGRELGA